MNTKKHSKEQGQNNDGYIDIRKQLILEERGRYLHGKGGKSYTWDEVRNMAINKERPLR